MISLSAYKEQWVWGKRWCPLWLHDVKGRFLFKKNHRQQCVALGRRRQEKLREIHIFLPVLKRCIYWKSGGTWYSFFFGGGGCAACICNGQAWDGGRARTLTRGEREREAGAEREREMVVGAFVVTGKERKREREKKERWAGRKLFPDWGLLIGQTSLSRSLSRSLSLLLISRSLFLSFFLFFFRGS